MLGEVLQTLGMMAALFIIVVFAVRGVPDDLMLTPPSVSVPDLIRDFAASGYSFCLPGEPQELCDGSYYRIR